MAKNNKEITEDIVQLLEYIDGTVDNITGTSQTVQQQLHELLQQQIKRFEIKGGRFISSQDLRKQMLQIEDKFNKILKGNLYSHSVNDYLDSFHTIAERNITIQQGLNDLTVEMKLLTPARRTVFEAAKNALLGSGIRSFYQEPIRQLLMQQILTGGTISDMEAYLQRWVDGDLSGSKSPTGKSIPNLQQYVGQIARDTSHQYNGTINNVIKDKYKLDGFIYTGGLIKDSRPLCVHLVDMDREISFAELKGILKDPALMPGRIPGTNAENFCTYRGGYNCRHGAIAVRLMKHKKSIEEVPVKKDTSGALLSDVGGFKAAINALRKIGKIFSNRKRAALKRAIINDSNFLRLTPDIKTGRNLFVHAAHNLDEKGENIIIGRKLNQVGYDVYLLKVLEDKGFKNADALLVKGKSIYLAEFKKNVIGTKRAIDGEIRSAAYQAPHVVIDINSDMSKDDLIRGIQGRIVDKTFKQAKRIKSVMLFYNDKFYIIERNQIENGDIWNILE